MEALNYLHAIINKGAAFVPESMALAISTAANTLGIHVSGGLYDPETDTRVLYLG